MCQGCDRFVCVEAEYSGDQAKNQAKVVLQEDRPCQGFYVHGLI